ncbi:MAG: UDP-2,4-diacetamido-2,4,6-trideoxy-beta-L-altropyranose hydrolase [Deltaproteobacteria bacterium]|nr:UDP-2,4-diacetamido-2,4,6-trideoxy-beta-L-altropyranose hydrolase [Deltaproteobacteria bacterium]
MNIIFRTDASKEIGTGHLMRCLAFAQGMKGKGDDVVFITHCNNEKLLRKISKESFKIYSLRKPTDSDEIKEILEKENADWVILDGYHFSSEYQRLIKDKGYRLLVVDDFAHLKHYYANIILNQNYGAENFVYTTEPYTKLLLGTKYVMLRQEFLEYSDYRKQIPDVAKKVLVTMGGGDPENNTLKVLTAVNLIKLPLDMKIVVGASNVHCDIIRKEARSSRHNIEILSDVDNMVPLMVWADVAVSAGGSTIWELAFVGIPSILCIVAANQERGVNALKKNEIFWSLGWLKGKDIEEISDLLVGLLLDKNLRSSMNKKTRSIVDGYGIPRIIEELNRKENILNKLEEKLRRSIDFGDVKFINFVDLTDDEKNMVRNWRNSDEIRKWMFTDYLISKEEHYHFIKNLKKDNRNFYWMVEVDNNPIGVVYFQNIIFEHKSGSFGIYSMKNGNGKLMLHYLLQLWFNNLQMHTLKCELMEGNERAYTLYTEFGFKEEGSRYVKRDCNTIKVVSMIEERINWESKNPFVKSNYDK